MQALEYEKKDSTKRRKYSRRRKPREPVAVKGKKRERELRQKAVSTFIRPLKSGDRRCLHEGQCCRKINTPL